MANPSAGVSTCVREVAVPALEAARAYLVETTEYSVEVSQGSHQVELIVTDREGDRFLYCLTGCPGGAGDCAGLRVSGSAGDRMLGCADCSIERVRDDCLEVCRHWLLC